MTNSIKWPGLIVDNSIVGRDRPKFGKDDMSQKWLWLVEFAIILIVLVVIGSIVVPQMGVAGP